MIVLAVQVAQVNPKKTLKQKAQVKKNESVLNQRKSAQEIPILLLVVKTNKLLDKKVPT